MGFDESPLLVIWETTQAYDLACVHCRPSATPPRHSSELSTGDAHRLLETIREFGNPLMLFTGGDPLTRPDLFALLGRSVALGLRTNISPNATSLLTPAAVRKFSQCGVARMLISLDGPNPRTHDAFRGGQETFAIAIGALQEARRAGLETQVQTKITRRNRGYLDEIAGLVASVQARLWSVSFPATSHLSAAENLTAGERAEVLRQLHRISRDALIPVQAQSMPHTSAATPVARRGFVLISHTGEIYPSGFRPISAGNVRFDSLVKVYRKSPLFLELCDAAMADGNCRFCHRNLCGRSRARANTLSGEFFGVYHGGDQPNPANPETGARPL